VLLDKSNPRTQLTTGRKAGDLLTVTASELIDELKAATNGNGGRSP
jgi:hypothetical protein